MSAWSLCLTVVVTKMSIGSSAAGAGAYAQEQEQEQDRGERRASRKTREGLDDELHWDVEA